MSATQTRELPWGPKDEHSTDRFVESPLRLTDQVDLLGKFLARAAARDVDALGDFYDETKSLVYGLALRIVGDPAAAEEVTLDVYTEAWRRARSFDPHRGSTLTWLLMLTRSRAIDCLRFGANRRRKQETIEGLWQMPDTDASVEDACPIADQRRRVRAALGRLNAAERQTIELTFFDGLTPAELAKRLNQPLATVRTWIRLAFMKLREELGRAV